MEKDDTVITLPRIEIQRDIDAAKGDRAIFRPPSDKSLCAARLIFKLPFGKLPSIPEMKSLLTSRSGGTG